MPHPVRLWQSAFEKGFMQDVQADGFSNTFQGGYSKADREGSGYLPANRIKTEGNDLQGRKILVSFTDSSSNAAGGEIWKSFSVSMHTAQGGKDE